jgi:phage I-like protein
VNNFTKAAARRVRPISHVTEKTATPLLALCDAAASAAAGVAIALAAESGAPDWVQLMPSGPTLQGRDGRIWRVDDVNRLVAQFSPPFVIDYEHAQDRLAVNGQEAPAAGWIEQLDVRNGGEIWGRVEWTPRAKLAIAAREYRFISPAFTFSPADGSVQALIGASLVNRPNFVMTALNAQEHSMLKEIAAALGLADTATSPEIVTAIAALKTSTALNAAHQPDLAKFVPRADYELALNRATTAEAQIEADRKAAHAAKVAAAIDGAIKAGKVAPASREYFLATCATEAGLAEFEKYVAKAPTALFKEIVDPKKDEPGAAGVALNSEQLAVAKALGIDPKAFAADIAKRAAARAEAA